MQTQSRPKRFARNHHYVSAGYLAQFTNTGTKKGQLCAVDFSTKQFFPAKAKEVACEADYNSIESETLAPDAYEAAQAKFEGRAIRQIREICRTGKLPNMEAFSYIYNLITLFAVKNPAIRNAMTRMQDTVYRQAMAIWTLSPTVYEQSVKRAKEVGPIRPDLQVPFETAEDFVQRGAFTIKIPSHSHVLTELSVFDDLASHGGTALLVRYECEVRSTRPHHLR